MKPSAVYTVFHFIAIHQQSFCLSDSIVTDGRNPILTADTLTKHKKKKQQKELQHIFINKSANKT